MLLADNDGGVERFKAEPGRLGQQVDKATAALAGGSPPDCAYCGKPIKPDDLAHVVHSAELGTSAWFHGTGVCNIVANGGTPLEGED